MTAPGAQGTAGVDVKLSSRIAAGRKVRY